MAPRRNGVNRAYLDAGADIWRAARRTIPRGSQGAALLRFKALVLQSGSQNVATGGPRVAGSWVLAMRAQQEPQQAPGPGTKVMALLSDYVHVKPGFLGACYFNKFK